LITDALGKYSTVILTQTDLILHALSVAETHRFSIDLESTIAASMSYCIRDVVTMSKLESALTGFLRLKEKNIPSMPIVDKDRLIGTLSKSDLIGLDKESFMKLSSPVLHYLHVIFTRLIVLALCQFSSDLYS
jgi:CBS-domain-containing membrane protein